MSKQMLGKLEECAIDICEEYTEDYEMAEVAMTFFMQCFFTHLPTEKDAKDMMLIIKQKAERCLHFGAN